MKIEKGQVRLYKGHTYRKEGGHHLKIIGIKVLTDNDIKYICKVFNKENKIISKSHLVAPWCIGGLVSASDEVKVRKIIIV